ncbi:Tumor necrosis factor receptor superfamily member 16 [Merluccius polli]|uniref:Tumor necrosis factor receptor superfamily member 16 n=1 Tax=Merluccius polli TaxID=89951 RepID=A0AA47MDZ4_MERPO|nr:Tumor necrosis factor receptor superfamily member 16 [Merluccius polli]
MISVHVFPRTPTPPTLPPPLSGETYSENDSTTEVCKPCTQCTGLMRMQTPCTDSIDATCVCDYNYFLSDLSGRCEPCTVCPRGQGVLAHCEYDHDTVCEECVDDTYSDRDSSLDPCLPCTICEDGIEKELAPCTPSGDSVCHITLTFIPLSPPPHPLSPTDPLLPTYPSTTFDPDMSLPSFTEDPPDGSGSPSPGETTTAGPGSPRFLGHGFNENLIPVYCSILAAVVVGLVAYIVFKRWNSCKQNKQPANNRAATANQTVTPEGEKLHSDSGISVDSQSLQEQHAHSQASRSHTQEQIVVKKLTSHRLELNKVPSLAAKLLGGSTPR